MEQGRIIPDEDLVPYLPRDGDRTLSSRMRALYEQQRRTWPQLRRAHGALKRAETRRIELGGCTVLCQHTPHRLANVSASMDPASIRMRPCFLCNENLYPEQKALRYGRNYLILCNIAPIFEFHLVIIHRRHLPQQIQDHFHTALSLARDCSPDFAVIYNGPSCGASIPDHFHLQAFPANNLPLEEQLWTSPAPRSRRALIDERGILISAPQGFYRPLLTFETRDPLLLSSWFREILDDLAELGGATGEPMINLVMAYREGRWQMTLFPREKHRPEAYYARGQDRLLISPGAIDMAGVFVIPRRKDYLRADASILKGIYREVTLSESRFSGLIDEIGGKKRRKGYLSQNRDL
ncbi:MAG: DUF4922 domain-containing protein [Deltaproteobacteria bacterium]|nr:DUF4922 domain-containing protein [Deltaproteobacteria bacterium]MBW2120709.1 DUF4922 domain-containing protein [Deltaproteobacteria bacterium]